MEKEELHLQYVEDMYEELTELGSGEIGKTYLAQHRGSGKIVIKKQIPLLTGGIYEKLRELHHSNLAQIYDICYGEENCVIIEEYISGETLEVKLNRWKKLPEETVLKYARQILCCLEEIHKRGIVHRDLTPANILISTDDVVKLIDFGIARNPKENQKKDTLILGTVGYASPEQFGFCQTDSRTDIYAFGILMNMLLTGRMPNEQLTESAGFQKIVQKCIQIDPEKRYYSVSEIRQELAELKDKERKNCWQEDKSLWPGFRSGRKWHQVVGVTGYVMMGIYSVASLAECGKTPQTFLLELLALMLYLGLTFLIATGFYHWDRRWKPFANMERTGVVTLRVIAAFCTFYSGILLENYVRYTMLGLPAPK